MFSRPCRAAACENTRTNAWIYIEEGRKPENSKTYISWRMDLTLSCTVAIIFVIFVITIFILSTMSSEGARTEGDLTIGSEGTEGDLTISPELAGLILKFMLENKKDSNDLFNSLKKILTHEQKCQNRRDFIKQFIFQTTNNARSSITGLCSLLQYQQGGDEGVNAVRKELEVLWKVRGNPILRNGLEKELCPVLSTFGIKGQGKTELCRQVVLDDGLIGVLPEVKYLVRLHVTFNQTSTYPCGGEDTLCSSIMESIAWRILLTLDSNFSYSRWEDYRCFRLEDIIDDIRAVVAKEKKIQTSEVGIIFMIDELMKVNDKDKIELLLNQCACIQQKDLSNSIATFFVITSLKYTPVHELRTKSGRPVKLIPLTVMSDLALEQQVEVISSQFHNLISKGNPNDLKRLQGSGIIRHYVNLVVWTSGKHFRSLEFMLDFLYHSLVPSEVHEQSVENNSGNSKISSCFHRSTSAFVVSNEEISDLCRRLQQKGSRRDISMQLFKVCAKEAMDSENADVLYKAAINCFLKLLVDSETIVDENYYFELENVGGLFVKWRDPECLSRIIPRVSLPFIYAYADSMIEREMTCFVDNIPLILTNIASSLNGLDDKLSLAFEEAMFNVELLYFHAHGLSVAKDKYVRIQDIMQSARVCVWEDNPDLVVNKKLLQSDDFQLVKSLSSNCGSSWDDSIQMIKDAYSSSSNIAIFSQGPNATTELIEYVGRHMMHVDANGTEKDVYVLCSMKLREANSITAQKATALAAKIHKLALTAGLAKGTYYVILYCCTPVSEFVNTNFEPGTIIVPFEDISRLLRPFGASFLLDEVTSKSIK